MKLHFTILISLLTTSRIAGQEPDRQLAIDAGIYAGLMNSLTDIGAGGSRSQLLKNISPGARPAAGLYGQVLIRERAGILVSLQHGTIAAADQTSEGTAPARAARNLSFRSSMTEAGLMLGICIINKRWYGDEGVHRFSVCVTGGASLFRFNPKARLDGRWYTLREYRLEGQGFDNYPDRVLYRLIQLALPAGLRVDRELTTGLKLGFECIYRVTFTDYLDDVSTTYIDPSLFDIYFNPAKASVARRLQYRQENGSRFQAGQPRGNAKKNDAWFSVMLKLGVSL
ncbi:MAG: hypothetical protein EOO09_09540 [Chitinophagaceae bacterium]|nr:MAG: hypothetical protein EOO09_09540 [Chitinophagaceae bacterium]